MKKLKDPNYKTRDTTSKLPGRQPTDIELFFTDGGLGFSIPEDVPDWVEQVCSTYTLDKEDALAAAKDSSEAWKLIENKENFRLFQDTKEPGNFKVFASFPKIKPLELFQVKTSHS